MTNLTATARPATPLDREQVRSRVDGALAALLEREIGALAFLGEDREPVAQALRTFILSGGKRIRPAFVYWGYRGAGGQPGPAAGPVLRASCCVELLHVCALIHDDIMDGSIVRRGHPAMHVAFAELHGRAGWRGDASAFGEGAAVLLGDLAFTWADVALAEAGLPDDRLAAGLRAFNVLRSELMGGQYLDLLEARRGEPSELAIRRMIAYKSAKYTIERPLHLGLALARGSSPDPALRQLYTDYGMPLGEAFQLRDDVLGVFGAPATTGKPAGDDLREGKETFLILRTRSGASAAGRRLLDRSLGDPTLSPEDISGLRDLIETSGALSATEARITILLEQALTAIAGASRIDPVARAALEDLAVYVTDRSA